MTVFAKGQRTLHPLSYTDSDIKVAGTTRENQPGIARSLQALIVKRAVYFYRVRMSPVMAWVPPLLTFLVLFKSDTAPIPTGTQVSVSVTPIGDLPSSSRAFVQSTNPITEGRVLSETFQNILKSQGATVDPVTGSKVMLEEEGKRSFRDYATTYILGVVFSGNR